MTSHALDRAYDRIRDTIADHTGTIRDIDVDISDYNQMLYRQVEVGFELTLDEKLSLAQDADLMTGQGEGFLAQLYAWKVLVYAVKHDRLAIRGYRIQPWRLGELQQDMQMIKDKPSLLSIRSCNEAEIYIILKENFLFYLQELINILKETVTSVDCTHLAITLRHGVPTRRDILDKVDFDEPIYVEQLD